MLARIASTSSSCREGSRHAMRAAASRISRRIVGGADEACEGPCESRRLSQRERIQRQLSECCVGGVQLLQTLDLPFASQVAPEADLQLFTQNQIEATHSEPVHVSVQFVHCSCCLSTFEAIRQPTVQGREVGCIQESRLRVSTQDQVGGDERYQDGPFISQVSERAVVESPPQVGGSLLDVTVIGMMQRKGSASEAPWTRRARRYSQL